MLLGIRIAIKEDLQSSSAELLYGEPLALSGDFFDPSTPCTSDMSDFTSRLHSFAEKLKPVPTSRHCKQKIFIFKDLATAKHVFFCEDALRASLQPAYIGPHKILERGDQIFKLFIKGKPVTVNVDRLKPAHFLCEEENLFR